MKKMSAFYKKDREVFTAILEKHIAETRYFIDRAYKTKSAGFEDIYTLDFKKLSKVSYVITNGLDMKVADSVKEDELRKYDAFRASKHSKYYVYVAYGVEEEVLYVGKGKGMRYSHCLHGGSTNPNINRYYFHNGEEGSISVNKVKYFESDEEALEYEKHLIKTLRPPFNVDFVESNQRNNFHTALTPLEKLYYGFSTDFIGVLKEYIKSLEDVDIDTTLLIEQRSSVYKNFVDVLGINRIKSIGMNKTKLTKAYTLTNNLNKNFSEIKSRLSSLRVGKKYTSTDIVNLLQGCYDDLNIERKAVSLCYCRRSLCCIRCS